MAVIDDLHRERAKYVEKHNAAQRRYSKNRLSADDEEMLIYSRIIKGIDERIADLIRGEVA